MHDSLCNGISALLDILQHFQPCIGCIHTRSRSSLRTEIQQVCRSIVLQQKLVIDTASQNVQCNNMSYEVFVAIFAESESIHEAEAEQSTVFMIITLCSS